MPLLRIQVADQTFEATLPATAVRVGSGPTCDLTLACEGVSTEHCVLEPMSNGAWRLKDLASGLPTLLNGTEVRQVSLTPGDVIELGAARVTYAPDLVPALSRVEGAAGSPGERPVQAPEQSTLTPSLSLATSRGPAPTATAAAARSSLRRLLVPLLLLAVTGGALVAVGLVGGGSGGTRDVEARAESDLQVAIERYRAKDMLGARALLASIVERVRSGDVARRAATFLASATQAVSQAEGELDGWTTRALDFDLSSAASRRAVFLEQHGPGFTARVDAVLARVHGEQQAWRLSEGQRVGAEVEPLLAEGQFKAARARWAKAKASAPRGVDLSAEVEAGLARVDEVAESTSAALLERIERAVGFRGAAVGVEMLGGAVEHYEGTTAHGRLAERLHELEQRAAHERATAPSAPTPLPGPTPATPGAPTPAPGQPSAPSTVSEEQLLKTLAADLAKLVAERAFAPAVERLDTGLARVSEGAAKAALTLRRTDLALARNGLDALAGEITAEPTKFGRLELGERLFGAPTAADRDGISCALAGGGTKLRWATMKRELLALLAERMQPGVQDALAVAALLNEAGAREASERMLVRAGEGGTDSRVLFDALSRWRGESVPEGGYVLYEGRYVAPAERERLILEARVRGGLDRLATARDATQRKAALAELLALGESAREPLRGALEGRRAALLDELGADKVWSSSRTRQRLYDLLLKRRVAALALIEDQAAYPYPNPTHQNQAEVERLVAEVREVWERPFRLVAAFDSDVQARLERLTELDEALAQLTPGYRPDLEHLERAAAKAVSMPEFAPGEASGQREHALKVLAYNEKLATSATREERDNVRAVNEYRMLMGRAPLRIEERLVRAARGHSRHMNVNGYFAHDAPAQFPEVRSPGVRARRQGYGGGVGENIAWGTPSGRDAFRAWFGSSGHHRNMLARGWTEMGAGRSVPHHWTQLFGAQGGRSLDEPAALPAPPADVAPDPEDAPSARPTAPLVPRLPDEKPPGEPPADPDPDPTTPGSGG